MNKKYSLHLQYGLLEAAMDKKFHLCKKIGICTSMAAISIQATDSDSSEMLDELTGRGKIHTEIRGLNIILIKVLNEIKR